MVDRHEKTDFLLLQLFGLRPFFDPSDQKKGQKIARAKIELLYRKSVKHAKEFLKSIHTGAVIL